MLIMSIKKGEAMLKKILLLCAISIFFCKEIEARRKGRRSACRTEESCLNDQNCQCYCSVKCGFREKRPDDAPVFLENDPYGNYCYCKAWDRDNVEHCSNN